MGAFARRWGKRLLWLLPTLLAIYCIVKLADFAWYRTQIPAGFNANWSGGWETRHYAGPSGRLLVRLPDPLPENQDFKVEVLVYYPIYSLWRTGQFVKMDFVGHFNPGDAASAGEAQIGTPGGSGILKFKSVAEMDQTVEYAALVDGSRAHIVGGYLSSSPYDYGHFAIRRY